MYAELVPPDAVQSIESGVQQFSAGWTVLVEALDEISNLHPYIKGALFAFQTAIKLEMTRRSNDKRVTALLAEMTKMMSVLKESVPSFSSMSLLG